VIAARRVQRQLRDLRTKAAAMPEEELPGEWASFLRAVERDLS
jgi:hypothetical protein